MRAILYIQIAEVHGAKVGFKKKRTGDIIGRQLFAPDEMLFVHSQSTSYEELVFIVKH